MPVSLFLYLPIPSSRRNLRVGLTVTYLKIGGLGIKSIFNKNIIELKDNEKYIKEAVNTVAILCIK